jgi:type IV pilus assembly protein PilF
MRWLSLLIVAFMIALTAGCATGSRRTGYSESQLKSLGEKALMAHQTATALKFLTEAERRRPNDASIQYDLALAYNQRGFQEQAVQHMQLALKIKPEYPEALNALGYMYATTGRFDLARAAFEKAMNDPFYQTPQIAALNLGELYRKRGDTVNALSYYRQAAKLDPHYAQAWYRIGTILEQSGKNEEARRAYETAVHESPEMAEAHLRLGIMSYRAGDYKEAAGAFGLVERLAPSNSEPANVARKYLDRINNNPQPAIRPSHNRSSRPQLENLESGKRTDPSVSHAWNRSDSPSPVVVKGAIAPANGVAPGATYPTGPPVTFGRSGSDSPTAALIAPSSENDVAPGSKTAAHHPGSPQYIVMVGSFTDRAKAEGIKSRLRTKGYSAVVRQDLGPAFVVELQPVPSFAEAAVLMSRLTGQTNSSPSIVVAPAH